MRVNTVKQKLAAGEPVIGTWLGLGDVTSARLMARAGWDYVCLDVEHTAVDWEKAAIIFGLVAEAGCVPLCRPPDGTMENIKRALDAGAWGIVAPMVDTLEQARAIVDSCYYPPFGRRSVGGGTHYLSLGTSDAEYKERANEAIACVLMTESPQGVENAPAIYALPGVDASACARARHLSRAAHCNETRTRTHTHSCPPAVFVGPNDMRAQMRRSLPDGRKPTVPEFEAAMAAVRAAGAAAKTPVGIHTFSVEECKARVAEGFRFMALSSDAGFLAAAATRAVEDLGIVRRSTAPGGAAAVGGAAVY